MVIAVVWAAVGFAFGTRVVYYAAFVCTDNSGNMEGKWPMSEAHIYRDIVFVRAIAYDHQRH